MLKNEHFANTHILRNVLDTQLNITVTSPFLFQIVKYQRRSRITL